jgi:RNA polymerase sigma-70 factor (ECF subfamily)
MQSVTSPITSCSLGGASAVPDEVDLLRSGSQDVLAARFLHYRDRLERMVDFRLDPRLWGRVDPADIVQEAYIEVARRIDSFLAAPKVTLFVWLRQITWQTLLDVHRRHLGQKRNAGQDLSLDERRGDSTVSPLAQQLAGSLTSPSQAAMRNERVGQLKQALQQMSHIDREILVLRHFEQLSNGEVAEILRLSKTAASNRYMRALKRLRQCLDSSASPAVGW